MYVDKNAANRNIYTDSVFFYIVNMYICTRVNVEEIPGDECNMLSQYILPIMLLLISTIPSQGIAERVRHDTGTPMHHNIKGRKSIRLGVGSNL